MGCVLGSDMQSSLADIRDNGFTINERLSNPGEIGKSNSELPKGFTDSVQCKLDALSANSNNLVQQGAVVAKTVSAIHGNLAQSLQTVISIANDVRQILSSLGTLSQELLAKIVASGYVPSECLRFLSSLPDNLG